MYRMYSMLVLQDAYTDVGSRETPGAVAEQKPAILRKAFAVKQSFRVLLTLLTYVPVGK